MNSNKNKEVAKVGQTDADKWKERAIYRKQNSKWLDYSGKIALRLMAAMEEIPGMTQRELSKKVGVSPQQVSKIVKGQENLTLQTIAKFSEIVGVELITFPEFKYNHRINRVIGSNSNFVAIFSRHELMDYIDFSPLSLFTNRRFDIRTEDKYITL